jgi:hypothetical protein
MSLSVRGVLVLVIRFYVMMHTKIIMLYPLKLYLIDLKILDVYR